MLDRTNEELREECLTSEVIFDGKILHLTVDTVRLPDGNTGTREVAWHRGAVCIVPITDHGDVLFVEQFRYPTGQVMIELPAGKLEASDSDPLAAAHRELEEETGMCASRMIPFGEYCGAPAFLSEKIYIYLALGLTPGHANPDEDEFIRCRAIPMAEAAAMIVRGEITDGKTQASVLRAKLYLEENHEKNTAL